MIALLPLTPLFTVCNIHLNITLPHKWIKSYDWLRNTLYKNKLRWKPGKCGCKDHSRPADDAERLCAATKVAFTIFAAQLVYTRLEFHNRCVAYLLHMAPNLTKIEIPRTVGQTPFTLAVNKALKGESEVLYPMLERGGHNLHNCTETLFQLYEQDLHYNPIADNNINPHLRRFEFLVGILARGNEDKIRSFRNEKGCSLLHLVCQQARMGFWNRTLVFCIKQLLHLGLNPAEVNTDKKTALDMLLYFFIDFWQCIENESCIDYSQYSAWSFIECVQAFLPYFTGTRMAELNLPQVRSTRYTSVEDLTLGVVTLFQGLVNKDLFPYNAEKYFVTFILMTNVLFCKRSYPCVFCLPLVDHLYKELCKGFDLNKCIVVGYYCGRPKILLERIAAALTNFCHYYEKPCTCHKSSTGAPAKRPEPCDCCSWSLLEMIVNCSANIDRLMNTAKDVCRSCPNTFTHLISSDVLPVVGENSRRNLSKISQVVKFIWMYHRASKLSIKDYLQKLYDDVNDDDQRDIVSDLQDLMESVRPLMLLCRLRILQNIEWKDIRLLNLPKLLKHYLQLGDISHDHVVRKIL